MDVENQNPKIDWLDAALRARTDAEPRVGLQERVLATLASEPYQRSAPWKFATALAAAVLVIAIALLVLDRNEGNHHLVIQAPEVKPSQKMQQSSLQPVTIASATRERHQPAKTHSGAACCVSAKESNSHYSEEQLPKLATFPAPRPETAEERMMARLAAQRDSFDLASISSGAGSVKDLSIPKLNIDPLEGTPAEDGPRK